MKKTMVLTAAVCAAVALASCSSSKESAYKKAYLAAQQQEQQEQAPVKEEAPVVAPVEETPAPAVQQPEENYDNVPVRHENVSYEGGESLKAFSVVVGSYSVKANADDMLRRLQNAGYGASIASATVNGTKFYRVISGTYDTKAEAARAKGTVSGGQFNKNSDAWLLAK